MQQWENGKIEWEDALLQIAKALETQYIQIVEENNLKEILEKTRFTPNDKLLIVERSLIPDISDHSPLKRQAEMIEVIKSLHYFYTNILQLLRARIENSSPEIIAKTTDVMSKNLNNFK